MPRYKKVAVTAGQRQDWLHRYEVEAQTPPTIAKKDGYDVRTVRKQIEIARQERDGREAKLMVLREAMVTHYKDLYSLAGDIVSEINNKGPIFEDIINRPLYSALKQHIPRSIVWKDIDRWNKNHNRLKEIDLELRGSLRKKIISEQRLNFMNINTNDGIAHSMVDFFIFQVNQWANGYRGLNIKENFHIERFEGQLSIPKVGAYGVGEINPEKEQEQVSILKETLADFEVDISQWELLQEMKNIYMDLSNLQRDTMEELNTIILRRVVPGRCKYCPL